MILPQEVSTRCTAFADPADRVQEVAQQSKVCIISKVSLRPETARFNHTIHESGSCCD
eukprot:jgi/Astpho2/8281/Aster-01363